MANSLVAWLTFDQLSGKFENIEGVMLTHLHIPGMTHHYFNLNYAGSDEERSELYPKNTIRTYLMKLMTNKSFMDFKTCKCTGLLYSKHCALDECFSAKLVSIVFSGLFFQGNNHNLQELRKRGAS